MDVQTTCHLKECIAIRVKPLLVAVNSLAVTTPLKELVKAFEASSDCRKSQQKFLHSRSTDITIKKARRGLGGNTSTQHCIIIAQRSLDQEDLDKIRQGMSTTCIQRAFMHVHACNTDSVVIVLNALQIHIHAELSDEPEFHTPLLIGATAAGETNTGPGEQAADDQAPPAKKQHMSQ